MPAKLSDLYGKTIEEKIDYYSKNRIELEAKWKENDNKVVQMSVLTIDSVGNSSYPDTKQLREEVENQLRYQRTPTSLHEALSVIKTATEDAITKIDAKAEGIKERFSQELKASRAEQADTAKEEVTDMKRFNPN